MRTPKLERVWVKATNSPWLRRLNSAQPVAQILKSGRFEALDDRRRLILARIEEARNPGVFDRVESLCLFIGHVKSGGSLLGAMVDSHPSSLIADEVDVVRLLKAGFGRDQVFHVLAKGSRRDAMKGRVTARRLDAYSLAVPGQWQGKHLGITVIGASRAGPTTRILGSQADLIEVMAARLAPIRLRFIHVVRNPLDPIGAMVRRGRRTLENACSDYGAQAERVTRLRAALPAEDVHTVHYESLVAEPASVFEAVNRFLGLEPIAATTAAAAALIDPDRVDERTFVDWTAAQRGVVRAIVDSHDFLGRYRPEVDVADESLC